MAKKMGEFEERPQVKEAMPVPLKREADSVDYRDDCICINRIWGGGIYYY